MAAGSLEVLVQARQRLEGIIKPTPLQTSQTFSQMAGAEIYLKPENLQRAGSFKLRGAYSVISALPSEERARGVVTYSSGNWAQGVALGAAMLGVSATVVMPRTPNPSKVAAARGYGAEVVLYGDNSNELCNRAHQLKRERGLAFIDPFGSPELVAGEASIGLEILDELPEVDIIAVPVGGGSLFAGIAAGAKARNPRVRMVGVQPDGSKAMKLSLQAGRVVEIDAVNTIAEGLGVKRPGEYVFGLLRDLADEIVTVSDDEIIQTILLLMERAKLVVEPSGAAALAAVLSGRVDVRDKRVAVVLSGGNLDLRRLSAFLATALPSQAESGDV